MPQDRESGATAHYWGKETAKKICCHLNGRPLSDRSNECEINGQRIIVKCAKPKTRMVGISPRMLERIDAVIGAFATDSQTFYLYKMTKRQYEENMRQSSSKRHAHLRFLTREDFEEFGEPMGSIIME